VDSACTINSTIRAKRKRLRAKRKRLRGECKNGDTDAMIYRNQDARFAGADTVGDSPFVGCRFVSFDIGATKLAKVIEHNVHGDIVRLLVWSQWWSWGTHDYSTQTVKIV